MKPLIADLIAVQVMFWGMVEDFTRSIKRFPARE